MLIFYDEVQWPGRQASYTGVASATAAWPPNVIAVLIWTTTDAFVAVGENATATTSSTPFTAFVPMIVALPQNTDAPWRVSAIRKTSDGDVHARPCTQQMPTS